MLFLYRVQNDSSELSSFNACETNGNSLQDLAETLQHLFQVDFGSDFAWRVRKSDGVFGYVWKDVTAKEFLQPLDGDFAMVRLLRHETLRSANERLPVRLIGQTFQPLSSSSNTMTAAPKAAAGQSAAKKRNQEDAATSAPPRATISKKDSPEDDEDMGFEADFGSSSAPMAKPSQSGGAVLSAPSVDEQDDGLTAEERAQIRIEERERAEKAEMERKVQEVRDADAAAQANADAKGLAWSQQRAKLEAWSGSTTNRKPIRALLSTMHTVLWEGAKWTQTSILVRPNEVRLAFRKAMLVVHPDKVSSTASAEVQVIAKYCFENLNAAYELFESTEMR